MKLFVVLEEKLLSSVAGDSVLDSSLVVFGVINSIKLGVSSKWKLIRGWMMPSGRCNDIAGVIGVVVSCDLSDVV